MRVFRGHVLVTCPQNADSNIKFRSSLPVEVTAGSRATVIRELRQARKGAAVTVLNVCRGGAWLSLVPAILLSHLRGFCKIQILIGDKLILTAVESNHVLSGFGSQVATAII